MKGMRAYAVVTQCLIQMFALMYLGYKIGADWWLKDNTWGAVLCVVGAIIGIIVMIKTVIKVGDVSDKRKDV